MKTILNMNLKKLKKLIKEEIKLLKEQSEGVYPWFNYSNHQINFDMFGDNIVGGKPQNYNICNGELIYVGGPINTNQAYSSIINALGTNQYPYNKLLKCFYWTDSSFDIGNTSDWAGQTTCMNLHEDLSNYDFCAIETSPSGNENMGSCFRSFTGTSDLTLADLFYYSLNVPVSNYPSPTQWLQSFEVANDYNLGSGPNGPRIFWDCGDVTKYKCNSISNQCEEDPNGPFQSLAACEASGCIPEIIYDGSCNDYDAFIYEKNGLSAFQVPEEISLEEGKEAFCDKCYGKDDIPQSWVGDIWGFCNCCPPEDPLAINPILNPIKEPLKGPFIDKEDPQIQQMKKLAGIKPEKNNMYNK